jgi:Replication-relaxation
MKEEPADLLDDEIKGAPQKRGFAFVAGDVAILKLLHEFRFLRCEDIAALSGRHQMSVYRRLFKLAQARYVTVVRRPLQKHVYGLAKRALPILVGQGSASPELLDGRFRTSELTELFFNHEMMLVDLHVMLTLASRRPDVPLELGQWKEGKELWNSVSFMGTHGQTKLPVRPDAFVRVIDRRRPGRLGANFFLEADRSHEPHPVFSQKLLAYWHYHEQGLHTKQFDIGTFRVLTVTVTQLRADNLCRMTGSLPSSVLPERARKYFLYTSLEALGDGAQIFGDVYHSAQDPSVGKPLIPPPPPQT